MYNPRTSSYSFKEIPYNARSIQNNSPLTTDFWRKELVNCIGYSFLKLLAPTFSINHHARAARYGRLGPTPPEQKNHCGAQSQTASGSGGATDDDPREVFQRRVGRHRCRIWP